MLEFIVFSSGSKGNCSAVKIADKIILVDCGLRLAQLRQALANHNLSEENISHIIITHEHSDHVLGLKTISKNMPHAKVLLTKGTYIELIRKTKMVLPNYECINSDSFINLHGLEFDIFPTLHDARESIAFTVSNDEFKFSYLTDCGSISNHILEKLDDTTHLAIEANYCPDMLSNGRYPEFLKQRVAGPFGHLSNNQTAKVLTTIKDKLEYVCLMHISENNNNPTIAQTICKGVLKDETILLASSQNNGAPLLTIK